MKRNKPSLAKLRSDIERIELPGGDSRDSGSKQKQSAGNNRGEQKDFELLDLNFNIPDFDFTIPDFNFELPDFNFDFNLEEVTMVTLSTKEIASAIGCNILTVRRNIHAGKLRAIKAGREYRVAEKDLKEWLDNRYRLRKKS